MRPLPLVRQLSTEEDLAKLGGYEWYASAPAAISFILYFVTMGLSMAVVDANLGMAFLLFIFAFVFIPISLYFTDVAYKECIRKGRELEEYESRRRNEANKKQQKENPKAEKPEKIRKFTKKLTAKIKNPEQPKISYTRKNSKNFVK